MHVSFKEYTNWDRFYNSALILSGGSANYDYTPANGEIINLDSFEFDTSLIAAANKTGASFDLIWDATGTPVRLAHASTADFCSGNVCYKIIGNGVKVLRVTHAAGNMGDSTLSSIIHYWKEI